MALAMNPAQPAEVSALAQPPPDEPQQTQLEKYGFNLDESFATSYVGKYTLYHTIGEGAFGKVKVAVCKATGEVFAIKIMDKRQILKQDFTSQVRREIYIMRSLKHKHIVRMHEVLSSESKLYIVMDYVRGGELFHHLEKNGRVEENQARLYFQQLVDGVDFCHRSGVAHRDLKPENILLDEQGDIRITDFGFSSMRGVDVNTDLLHTQCGTPDYCAPEIIECSSKGYSGAKVDAWSCGIILYALLAGRLPFVEQDTEKLYDLILACRVEYPKIISPQARDLLQHLLVRNPDNRYDLQGVKQHPWFLENYEGDDARLLKKRPFFNKNNQKSLASAPSTPAFPDPPSESSVTKKDTSSVEAKSDGLAERPAERPLVPQVEPDRQFFSKAIPKPVLSAPATPAVPVTPIPPLAASTNVAREPSPQKRPEPFLPFHVKRPELNEEHDMAEDDDEDDDIEDDNASEGGDSVEDYTEKPVPELELPIEPLSLNRSRPAQNERPRSHVVYPHLSMSRSQQPIRGQKSEERQLPAQRHRSDVTENSAARTFHQTLHGESASLSSLPAPRRAFTTAPPTSAREPTRFRVRAPDPNPNSPHFTSVSNGVPSPSFVAKPPSNSGTPDYGSGSFGNGRVIPDLVGSSRVTAYAAAKPNNSALLQTEVTARHVWSIVNKWRGTQEPISPSSSLDILSDFRVLQTELGGLSVNDKSVVLERFLTLFEAFGLAELQSRQNVSNAIRNRHRLPSGEFEPDGDEDSTLDGRDEIGHAAGERRHNSQQSAHRRPPTDVSSEEETLSWSPVLAENSRQQSDLARRREMSDLLNRWILKTGNPPATRSASTPAQTDDNEPSQSLDIQELQRLMRQHQSGREESNLADELYKLVHAEHGNDSEHGFSSSGRPGDNAMLSSSLNRWQPHSKKSRSTRPPTRLHSDFSAPRFGADSQGNLSSVADGYSQGEKSSASVGNTSDNSSYALMTERSLATSGGAASHGRERSRPNMATSMGMQDVEYYGPERKTGMATKIRGALLTMKVRNQKLAESLTQFKSNLPVEEIIRIMVAILQNVGGTVTLKKETKRKIKCRIHRTDDYYLCAAIDFQTDSSGSTLVIFKRSKEDRGRTDVTSFHEFYDKVKDMFIAEVQSRYDRNRAGGVPPKRRRSPRFVGTSVSASFG